MDMLKIEKLSEIYGKSIKEIEIACEVTMDGRRRENVFRLSKLNNVFIMTLGKKKGEEDAKIVFYFVDKLEAAKPIYLLLLQ